MAEITQIDAYSKEVLTYRIKNGTQISHDVYTHGEGEKILVLIQELPGIGQETLSLADRFVARGYTVVLPHLFGPIGRTAMVSNLVRVFCMRREFRIFSKNKSSPIVDYLSQLCKTMKERYEVKGVAVIGMCLTGNFAISLMASDAVLAGFASQPSLPIGQQASLHMSPEEISLVRAKLDEVGPMHCGRFKGDRYCKKEKFDLIKETFDSDDNKRIIFHELSGDDHAILTLDFVDKEGHATKKALLEVMDYFDTQLK